MTAKNTEDYKHTVHYNAASFEKAIAYYTASLSFVEQFILRDALNNRCELTDRIKDKLNQDGYKRSDFYFLRD